MAWEYGRRMMMMMMMMMMVMISRSTIMAAFCQLDLLSLCYTAILFPLKTGCQQRQVLAKRTPSETFAALAGKNLKKGLTDYEARTLQTPKSQTRKPNKSYQYNPETPTHTLKPHKP